MKVMRFQSVLVIVAAILCVSWGMAFAQERPVSSSDVAPFGVTAPTGSGRFGGPLITEVGNPRAYYPETTAGQGAQVNPLPAPACIYSIVYDSGTYYNMRNAMEVMVTSSQFNQGSDPTWAFIYTIPADACGGWNYVAIRWNGQTDVSNGSSSYDGVAMICEVEQTVGGTTYTVPCPNTDVFKPWMVRNDYDWTGQQAHSSYEGVVLRPDFVNGGSGGPVTIKIGFVKGSNSVTGLVLNQHLGLSLGSVSPPVVAPSGGSRDRK